MKTDILTKGLIGESGWGTLFQFSICLMRIKTISTPCCLIQETDFSIINNRLKENYFVKIEAFDELYFFFNIMDRHTLWLPLPLAEVLMPFNLVSHKFALQHIVFIELVFSVLFSPNLYLSPSMTKPT